MRLIVCAAAVGVVACLAAAPGMAGKGGPTPDPLFGWEGVTSPSGAVRYVAMADWKQSTMVATIRVEDGRVMGWGTFKGTLGIPLVAWDGTKDGLSADGKRLVLASYSPRPYSLRTTFAVVDTKTMKSLRRIELPGHWAFDALSPNGNDDLRAPVRRPRVGPLRGAGDRRRHGQGRAGSDRRPARAR